jgi:hypothetical protein
MFNGFDAIALITLPIEENIKLEVKVFSSTI